MTYKKNVRGVLSRIEIIVLLYGGLCMKNKVQNILITTTSAILSVLVILPLILVPKFGRNESEQEMLFAITGLFFSMGVVWFIMRYIEKSTIVASAHSNESIEDKQETLLDVTSIDVFLKNNATIDEEVNSLLNRIKNNTHFVSSRLQELEMEQQHVLERMINTNLDKLLAHYQDFPSKDKQTFKEELLASLSYINHQLEDTFIRRLNEQSVQQFQKTRTLLLK